MARSSLSNRPKAVGPVPLMLAPRAPHWIRVFFRSATRFRWRSGRASSKTLYIRRATPARSPASSAATTPLVSGRQRRRTLSILAKSAGVEMENSGLHSTTQHLGRGGRGVRTSPRPSARAVPPMTQ